MSITLYTDASNKDQIPRFIHNNPIYSQNNKISDQAVMKEFILDILDEKKASEIKFFDISHCNLPFLYTICATHTSNTALSAIVKYICIYTKKYSTYTTIVEGTSDSKWIAVDMEHIILHLFTEETRKLYEMDSFINSIMHNKSNDMHF